MPDYAPDTTQAPVLTFNPFAVQGPQQAAPQQMQQVPPQEDTQMQRWAPPQPPTQEQVPQEEAPTPAPVLTFNPFAPRDVGQHGLPQDILPNPKAQAQQADSVPGTPEIPSTPDTGQTVDQNTASLIKAGGVSALQGVVEKLQGVNELAADLGQKLHIVSPEFAAGIKASNNSERAQYNNLSFIKENPGTSRFINQNVNYALGTALPAGAAIQGTSMAAKLGADILTNAVAGSLESVGNSQTPFWDRLKNGMFSGMTAGVVSAPFRYLGGLKGVATPEVISAQQANARALEPVGGGTVGQIIGDSNGLTGNSIQGTEAKLAGIPLVGGKSELIKQQAELKGVQKDFVKSLSPNPADIAHLTPAEMAAALESNTPLTDAAITKAYSTIKETADAAGPVSLEAVAPDIDKLAKSLQRGPEGHISLTASDKVVASKIEDLANTPNPTFQQLWDFRKNLDDSAFTQAGVLKPSTTASSGLATLRKSVSTALQQQADKAGFGEQWGNISKQYAQNVGFKKIQDMMDLSYSPLGRGGMSPGRGMMTFARNLNAGLMKGVISLQPEQKAAAQGVIKLTTLMAKSLRKVNPELEGLSRHGLAAVGGVGAAAFFAGGIHGVGMAALATKGLSTLLNSGVGRSLLTYAGKQPLQSLKLQSIAMKLMQTFVGGEAAHISNNKNSQYGTE